MFKSAYVPFLSQRSIRALRSELYRIEPSVVMDQWLDDSINKKIDDALNSNELIKIRTNVTNGNELANLAYKICDKFKATLIQTIGYMIAIYRENPDLTEE